MRYKSLWVVGTLLVIFLFFNAGQEQEAFSAQSWFFKWTCINVSGCAQNGIPASKTEGPYSTLSQCNSARGQMTSANGFRVGSCYSVGSSGGGSSSSQNPPPINPEDLKPKPPIFIPNGKELDFYCGAAQGILKGSTREWYLGCCPRSHPILRSTSPTVQCGTEEARKIGLECQCYKETKYCISDKDNQGICY